MIEDNSIRSENIAKMLDKSVNLFRNTGLEELAQRWNKILKNYIEAKKLR